MVIEGKMCGGTFTLSRVPVSRFHGGEKPDTCQVICPHCHKEQGAIVRRRDGDAVVVRINYHDF